MSPEQQPWPYEPAGALPEADPWPAANVWTCKRCGALVANTELHDRWHEEGP